MLLDAGADPTKRTRPDSSFRNGVTPLSITRSKSVKKMLRKRIAEVKKEREAAEKAAEGQETVKVEVEAVPKEEL